MLTTKITRKIVKNRLDWFIENNDIIPSSQFGFRKQKSTQDSTTLLAATVYLALSRRQVFGVLMLDLEGAFNNEIIRNSYSGPNLSQNF